MENRLSNLKIRKVAVLGAGVMGAQIAAHCANADVPVVLFDLPAKEGKPNGIVDKALVTLARLDPAPLAVKERLQFTEAANYGADLAKLAECDLIIEAIAEKTEWKLDRARCGLMVPKRMGTASMTLPASNAILFHAFRP